MTWRFGRATCQGPRSWRGAIAWRSGALRSWGTAAILALGLTGFPVVAPAQESGSTEQPAAQPIETIPVQPTETARKKEEPPAPKPDTNGATELGTVTVTATKRAKTARDIPGSVNAVRGEQLEAMGAQGMKDYFKLIPGVTYIDQGNEESIPVIRGITATTDGLGVQATATTTGIFLDDMPFNDLYAPLSVPDMNPFDLDRVEVLKGPQGTLFGGSTLAGAVRYITHKPDHAVWETKFSQTVSNTEGDGGFAPVTAGAINVPLFGDALALRAVGVRRREPGLYDMGAQDNAGNDLRNDPNADTLRQTSGRILASWNPPIENLKLSAFYFTQKTHQDDVGQADNFQKPQSGANVGRPFPSPRDHDFAGANLLATYDFGWGRLLSTTNRMTKHNYLDVHQEYTLALDHQNQNEFFAVGGNEVGGYTEELRLSSPEVGHFGNWEWVAGAAYLNYKQAFWVFDHIGPDIPDPKSPDQVTELQRDTDFFFGTIDSVGTEKALFGEVTRRLGEHWEATLGARKYWNHLVADSAGCGQTVLALLQEPCFEQHQTTSASGVNPKASIRFLLNRNVQMYALVAKGFQFGGFQINPPFTGAAESAQQSGHPFVPYKSSTLWNYETGVRTEWLNRRLRLDLTFFYLNWKDLQLTILVPITGQTVPGGANTFAVIANVGAAHSKGIETALEVIPFTGARWASGAAWIIAVTDVPFDEANPAGPVPAGSGLPGTPHFMWSNVVSYQHSLPYFSGWTFGPVLTHAHLGSSPDNIRATGKVGGYDTLDARLALTMVSSRFQPELGFGVNNLTDVRGVTAHSGGDLPDGRHFDLSHFVPPRTVMLSLGMKY